MPLWTCGPAAPFLARSMPNGRGSRGQACARFTSRLALFLDPLFLSPGRPRALRARRCHGQASTQGPRPICPYMPLPRGSFAYVLWDLVPESGSEVAHAKRAAVGSEATNKDPWPRTSLLFLLPMAQNHTWRLEGWRFH